MRPAALLAAACLCAALAGAPAGASSSDWLINIEIQDARGESLGLAGDFGCRTGALDGWDSNDQPVPASSLPMWMPASYRPDIPQIQLLAADIRAPLGPEAAKSWDLVPSQPLPEGEFRLAAWNPSEADIDSLFPVRLLWQVSPKGPVLLLWEWDPSKNGSEDHPAEVVTLTGWGYITLQAGPVVPEPSGLLVLGAGSLAAALARRYRS